MTVFYCAKCGTALTGDLVALPAVPQVDDPDDGRDKKTGRARSTVPGGHYAIDPEPWGAPFVVADEPRRLVRSTGRELLRTYGCARPQPGVLLRLSPGHLGGRLHGPE